MKHSFTRFFHRWQGKALLMLLLAAALLLPAQNGVAGSINMPCPVCPDTNKGWMSIANGDGTHNSVCANCFYNRLDRISCSGGTATCTVKAKCTTCGQFYGDYAAHTYLPVGSSVSCLSTGWIYYTCSLCKNFYSV